MSFEDNWKKLEACGYAATLSKKAAAAIRKNMKREDLGEHWYLHLATLGFDLECIVEPGSYAAIINDYVEASHGGFQATQIVDDWDEAAGTARVGFTLDGATHELVVPVGAADWFDMDVHELINQALEQAGREERFLPLPFADQVFECLFTTPAAMKLLEDAGIIPTFDDDDF